MTKEERTAHKSRLKEYCRKMIEDRILSARNAMNNAQQSANQEEKSSAGDKYETSRAMSHIEKDMHARQLAEHLKELAHLNNIDVSVIHASAQPGAYISCGDMAIFIGAGIGKQATEEIPVLFVSPQAPLALLLRGKKAGDSFLLGPVNKTILDIY